MRSSVQRFGSGGVAVLGAAALIALSAAPGSAATPVAQARAAAVSLTVGGQQGATGSYEVKNDGTQETATGSNKPTISLLGGQSLIKAGTLAQDATTRIVNSEGRSAACAGLAGEGSSLVDVGTSGTCLQPGQAVTVDAGSLDLSGLQIVSSDLLQGFDAQLTAALQPVLQPLTAALQTGLAQAVGALGLAVNLDFGAIQSACTAQPGSADGTARLAGARAFVQVGGQSVDLVNLPVDPAPNTHLTGNLGDVAALVETAVQTQLQTVLNNLPGGVALPIGVSQAAVLNNALTTIGQQLQPLQDNVIDVVLNKQTKASPDQIEVTALDLTLLPVAQQQAGITAFNLKIGTSACGPTGRVAAAPAPTPTATPIPKGPPPAVPTRIPAGLASAPPARTQDAPGDGWGGPLAIAGLVLVAVGATGAAGRRWSTHRS